MAEDGPKLRRDYRWRSALPLCGRWGGRAAVAVGAVQEGWDSLPKMVLVALEQDVGEDV